MKIKDKIYHIECQSSKDGTMIIRMIEYDFMIALYNIDKEKEIYEMQFPHSAVVNLRGISEKNLWK